MVELRSAKRYAKGLLLFSRENEKQDVVYSDMTDIISTIKDSDELDSFLKSLAINNSKKLSALSEIFSKTSKETIQFLKLLAKNNKLYSLEMIAGQYIDIYNRANNIVDITITTATEISETTNQEILKLVDSWTSGFKTNIINKVDSSIMGGFIVRMGDKQLDNSVKSKLNRLSKKLTA